MLVDRPVEVVVVVVVRNLEVAHGQFHVRCLDPDPEVDRIHPLAVEVAVHLVPVVDQIEIKF